MGSVRTLIFFKIIAITGVYCSCVGLFSTEVVGFEGAAYWISGTSLKRALSSDWISSWFIFNLRLKMNPCLLCVSSGANLQPKKRIWPYMQSSGFSCKYSTGSLYFAVYLACRFISSRTRTIDLTSSSGFDLEMSIMSWWRIFVSRVYLADMAWSG